MQNHLLLLNTTPNFSQEGTAFEIKKLQLIIGHQTKEIAHLKETILLKDEIIILTKK